MSERTGTSITCDKSECGAVIHERTPEFARERATLTGWTRTEDGRDFCFHCSEARARRKKPRDLVPAGVKVRKVFDAADAVGWERREYGDGDRSHFFCCGAEVQYFSMLGDAYAAKCSICGAAIESVLAPSFGRSSVAFVDSDKVDTEDPEHWVALPSPPAAASETAASGGATTRTEGE